MPELPDEAVAGDPAELTDADTQFLKRLDEERTELVRRRLYPDVLRRMATLTPDEPTVAPRSPE